MRNSYCIPLTAAVFVVLVVVAVLMSGRSHSPKATLKPLKSPWSQLGGNAQHTCVGKGCGAKGKVAWVYQAGGIVEGSSVIGEDGTIFFCSHDGYLHAVDGSKGRAKWKVCVKNPPLVAKMLRKGMTSAGDGFSSPTPALSAAGVVIVASRDGSVYAFDVKTGKQRWRHKAGALFGSSAAIGHSGAIRIESREAGGLFGSSPAVGPDGTVYIGSDDKRLCALNPVTGKQLWKYDVPQEPHQETIASQPVVSRDNLVYVGTSHGLICAIYGDTGLLAWKRDTRGYMSTLALGGNGLIYAAAAMGFVYALNSRTGAVVWDIQLPAGTTPAMAIGPDGTVYIATYDIKRAMLHAIDPGSGAKLWEHELGRSGNTPKPCIASDGAIYIQGKGDLEKRTLHAIEGRTGEAIWSLDISGGSHPEPVVGADGTIYIGSYEGKFYAIR